MYCIACSPLSEFLYNLRFQIAVLVLSADTERNKSTQRATSSGTACWLKFLWVFVCFELFFFLNVALSSHQGMNIQVPRVKASAIPPCLVASRVPSSEIPCIPCIPVACTSSALKVHWQLFYFMWRSGEPICHWSHWRGRLSGFRQ